MIILTVSDLLVLNSVRNKNIQGHEQGHNKKSCLVDIIVKYHGKVKHIAEWKITMIWDKIFKNGPSKIF